MADSSRVFEVGPLGSTNVDEPIRAAYGAEDILSRRRPGWFWPVMIAFGVAGLAILVSATAMGGSGSTGKTQIAAVQAGLDTGFESAVRGVAGEEITGSSVPWDVMWVTHPGLAENVPITILNPTGELIAAPLGRGRWLVSRLEGGPMFAIGETPILGTVVVAEGDGQRVDLGASLLRARARTLGLDEAGVAARRAPAETPEDAAEGYLAALLGADGPRLAGLVASGPGVVVLRYPETFGRLTGAEQRYVVDHVELRVSRTAVTNERHVEVIDLSATTFDPVPTSLGLIDGCVFAAAMETPAGELPVTDCRLAGFDLIGRPVPLDIVVTRDVGGWRVDHVQTEAAAWASLVAAGEAGVERLEGALARWGLLPEAQRAELIPLLPGAMPSPDSRPGEDTAPPIGVPMTSNPPASGQPVSMLPPVPVGAVVLSDFSGDFDAFDLAALGMVGAPEDLLDFGFIAASGTTWQEGDEGALVLVVRYDSARAAASEFSVFHGGAQLLTDPLTAEYGPGDFGGPTDRGAGVAQYRVVTLSGPDHILIETWGHPDGLVNRAVQLQGQIR